MKKLFFSLIVFGLLLSCNKEKRYSIKLQKGEIWQVEKLIIDGEETKNYGEWLIIGGDAIYDSVPKIHWIMNNFGDAVFEWQFQNKGKSLQLNYMQQCSECDGNDMDTLDYVAYNLTGKYSVEQHRRNKMRFSSTKTIGYSGQNVEISIERK